MFADTAIVVAHENAKAAIVGERRPTAVPRDVLGPDDDRPGGTVLELSYVGKHHSDNSLVMRFPREKILFAVDFIPVNSYSFRDFPDAYMPDWIESLRRVEAMEFDVLAPGHGPPGTKANVTMFREYLQDLRTDVIRYTREGKSVDEMKQLITLPKYAAWGPKEWFPLNIEGMHRLVQANRRPN